MTGTAQVPAPEKRALLETTTIIDRLKMPLRRDVIEGLLDSYSWKYTTSIAVLEFKATVIQECIFLHNQFRAATSFGRVRDQVTESKHRQQALRLHIIHNMLQVCETIPHSAANRDQEMAEMAAEALENIIPGLYEWCVSTEHVDQVLRDRVGCTRAAEPPTKLKVRFDTNLPRCRRGQNKFCRVEAVLRQQAETVRTSFSPLASPPDAEHPNQFRRTLDVLEKVCADGKAELSHDDCRNAGDCLIAIEGSNHATHALSTNKTEWQVVAPMMKMDFVHITYPS